MIIGLCGYIGSGKSKLSEYIANNDTKIAHIGFADPLYDMLYTMGLKDVYNKEKWDDHQELLGGKTIRYACQTLGTEWGRTHFGDDIWSNIAVKKALASEKLTIIDNVRYLSEFDAIIGNGGIVISFNANNNRVPDLSHSSEREIQQVKPFCAYSFTNDFTRPIEYNAVELHKMILAIAGNRN